MTQPQPFQSWSFKGSGQAMVLAGLAAAVVSIGATSPGRAQTPLTDSASPATETDTPEPDADTVSPAETADTASPAEIEAVETSLDRFTYANLFAIGVPVGWQATEQANAPQVVLTNRNADNLQGEPVRIEITWHEQPPEVVVAQLLNDLKSNDYRVSRYETQGIDNTTALNIWLSNLPDDFPNAYMSYIGYTDTTAAVVSYYTNPNTPLAAQLVEIHESFERLD